MIKRLNLDSKTYTKKRLGPATPFVNVHICICLSSI